MNPSPLLRRVGGRPVPRSSRTTGCSRRCCVGSWGQDAAGAITILSYDDVVDLRDLAGRLAQVDEQQWLEAGGQMLDCVYLEPGCAPS